VQPAKRFEELAFWQQARELTRLIYALTQKNGFAKDYGLKDQVQRAAVSVMSNTAEGFSRGTNVEFVQFLFIAKGSLSEVHDLQGNSSLTPISELFPYIRPQREKAQ
jgi:hypothetical protein